ncbi:hypothetical protein HJFPF1_13254 [Paramyrothecium foliicola]|nr:hypothetical protein HJFPF1_13254 [Paramyrothecium foliicola]
MKRIAVHLCFEDILTTPNVLSINLSYSSTELPFISFAMMRQTILSIATLASIAAVSATPVLTSIPAVTPPKGYTVQDPTWEVDVIPGQPPVVFNGTIQQVLAQLQEEYPDYAAQALERISKYLKVDDSTTPAAAVPEALTKRDHNVCWAWPWGNTDRIREGIAYLRGVGGRPRLRAGPGSCDRVSCSYKSAIWWCNDNHFEKEIGSFSDIANAAVVIINECQQFVYAQQYTGWYSSGQRFHNDLLNVIIRGDDC